MRNQCYYCQQIFESKDGLFDHLDVHARIKTHESTAQEPTAQEPTAQKPVPQEPTAQELRVQELTVQKLTVQKLTVQELNAKELTVQEPIMQEHKTQEPVTPEPEVIAEPAPEPEPQTQEPRAKRRRGNPAVCTDCGAETMVPFTPKEGVPVYCKECLTLHRSEKLKKLANEI